MNILMAVGEALPFSKTGGLGDVAYSLSAELVKADNNVAIILPLYKDLEEKYKPHHLMSFKTQMNWRSIDTDIIHVSHEGIDYYFVANDYYFKRNGGIYGYLDDGERYAFLCLATIEFLKRVSFSFDILHVHDWQTAMLPCLLKTIYANDPKLNKIRTILTIHNPLFKGYFSGDSLYDLYGLDKSYYDNGLVRLDNQVSTLKAGIHYADRITTVSPTHAEELLTSEGGKGLEYDLELRRNDFKGIVNGIDYKEFNHARDPYIYSKFTNRNRKSGKRANKVAFCAEFGLNPDLPLFAVVSRLTSQKGLDIIREMVEVLAKTHMASIAIVGSGEKEAEDYFNNLQRRFPNFCTVYIGYNNELAHKVYAASDFFIMPSAFEPCGIGQMIAQRYGSLPIVRRTGGLKDTVIPLVVGCDNVKEANGFGFDEYSPVIGICWTAYILYLYSGKPKVIEKMVLNAMTVDHSWEKSAKEYIELYESCL